MTVNPYEPTADAVFRVDRSRRRLLAVASFSLLVYLIAFFLPVFDTATPQVMYGYQAFVFAILSVKFIPTWLANPLYWMALRFSFTNKLKSARRLSFAAAMMAVCQLWLMDDAPEIGFYLWSGAMAVLGIGMSIVDE